VPRHLAPVSFVLDFLVDWVPQVLRRLPQPPPAGDGAGAAAEVPPVPKLVAHHQRTFFSALAAFLAVLSPIAAALGRAAAEERPLAEDLEMAGFAPLAARHARFNKPSGASGDAGAPGSGTAASGGAGEARAPPVSGSEPPSGADCGKGAAAEPASPSAEPASPSAEPASPSASPKNGQPKLDDATRALALRVSRALHFGLTVAAACGGVGAWTAEKFRVFFFFFFFFFAFFQFWQLTPFFLSCYTIQSRAPGSADCIFACDPGIFSAQQDSACACIIGCGGLSRAGARLGANQVGAFLQYFF
jgi:hypothetical protein